MARVNLCPNPSLKNDTTDWFGGGSRVSGVANMVRTTGYSNANASTTLPRGTVVAGRTYRFSAYVKGNGGDSSGNVNINWYGGGAYKSSAPGQNWTATDGQQTRVESGAQVAPAGADQALLNITGADNGLIVTGVLYEETSSLLEFFDGDTAGASWNGTDGSSTSTNTVGDSGEPPPPPAGSGDSNSDEAGVTQGWGTPIYNEDFNYNGTPKPEWDLYGPGPGHIGNGRRLPERVTVTNGVMRISGLANGDTGGMAHQVDQRYGRWEVRVRAYQTGTSGDQYHPVCIIWPGVENWPRSGEYDFQENDVGDTSAGAFIHYPHPNLPVQQEHATQSGVKIADWHNYAIDWQPTGITGYIDGKKWYHFSGGAGPAGRSDIQGMTPDGHLTLQLDNFTGSGGLRPANMDIDWVRVWSKDSVAQNTGITGRGIASAENFGTPLLGNRFRMYLTNSAAPVSTATAASWEQTTGSVQKLLGLNRGGSNTTVTVAETSTSNTFDVLAGQWISPPMTSSGTLKGAYSYVMARSESDTAADFFSRVVIKVVSNDGTVLRGVASDAAANTLEFTTTSQAATFTSNIETPVAVQVGDRLVVELGARAQNVVNTSYSATFRYGGTSGDVESGDTTLATTASPWINFADKAVQALFFGQTLTVTSALSSEAFGTATVTHPPTREILSAGGIVSAGVFGSPVVHAEAAIVAPSGFGGEVFGTASISNAIVVPSIDSAEAFGSHRVRRLSDIFIDAGIPTAEAFGALTLVHFQELAPPSIESAEAFGLTEVEDPARNLHPFGIVTAEAFGFPTLSSRMRSVSILSAEAFGAPIVKRGFWKLVQPTRIERWRLGDPGNVIYVRNVVGLTVLGDDTSLRTVENPRTEDIVSAKYVWQGGHDNITDNSAFRDLWIANGYQVEMSF